MLPNLLQLLTRRPPADYERAFVREVTAEPPPPARSRQIERLLAVGWLLIVLKSLLVWWACATYPVPYHPLWIILPTVAFALLCTAVYVYRR